MVPRIAPLFFCALAMAFNLSGRGARAATHALAPPGGGLGLLEVNVDLEHGVVRAGGTTIPIGLERSRLPAAAGGIVTETLEIGQGRHVVHVRVPARDADAGGGAWEAIVAAGQPQPLFVGITGLAAGDPGERTGKVVQIIAKGEESYVLVGDIREDLTLCGRRETLLDPLALYPGSLDFRPAGVQRLSDEDRASAVRIDAADKGSAVVAPLSRLLSARGSSVPGSNGSELTDGNIETVWREGRPGAGRGEFVVMAAPPEVPLTRMGFVLSPPAGATTADEAVPKTVFLVIGAQIVEVTFPEGAQHKRGEVYEVVFPHPVEAACVSLVLGDAYGGVLAHPNVGIAELMAYSEFDTANATLVDVAAHLSGPRGRSAAQVLERAGTGAVAAISNRYAGLDERGRALAVDVASSSRRCEEGAPVLIRAWCGGKGEANRKAKEKLSRCASAGTTLIDSLRTDASLRSCVAPILAAISPREALAPIADTLAEAPDADSQTRATLRGAFSEALEAAASGALGALLGDPQRSPRARLEIMRAAHDRVTEARGECDATLADLLDSGPTMRVRYLVLEPMARLAASGDGAATARLVGAIGHDADWPVRARAAELASGLPQAQGALTAAARDPEPRVREAALGALAANADAAAVVAAVDALSGDGWSFIRTSAINVLMNAPASSAADAALGRALGDPSARVRGAAVVALGRRRAKSLRGLIRQRLDDDNEDAEVRVAAARALGSVCDVGSTDRLTELARTLGSAVTTEDDRGLAVAALAALAALHPRDLAERLAPLRAPAAPPAVRAAAEQAISAPARCQ